MRAHLENIFHFHKAVTTKQKLTTDKWLNAQIAGILQLQKQLSIFYTIFFEKICI